MDTTKLIEIARKEGSEQAFGEAYQEALQAAAKDAVTKLATTNAEQALSITKLETSNGEFADEMKPLQTVLKERGLTWRNADDLAALGKRLDGEAASPADIQAAAKVEAERMVGPMTDAALEPIQKELKEAKVAVELAEQKYLSEQRRADFTEVRFEVHQATTGDDKDGKARPQLIGAHSETFLKERIMPFVVFEERENALGKMARLPAARHDGTPIFFGSQKALIPDLVAMAYEGKGDKPWNQPECRHYFASHGTGSNSSRVPGAKDVVPQQKRIVAATTVAEVEAAMSG